MISPMNIDPTFKRPLPVRVLLLFATVILSVGRMAADEPAGAETAGGNQTQMNAPGPVQDEARERERTRAGLIQEVDRSWQRPESSQERAWGTDPATGVARLNAKLEAIVLPEVSFTRVPIGQVVTALGAASEEFDATGTAAKGVNLILLDPSNRAPVVTLMLREVSLKRVLDFVAEAAGYQYEVQADAVILRPAGQAAPLETAFFPVTRATVLRMTGRSPANEGAAAGKRAAPAGAAEEPAGGPASGETAAVKRFLELAGVNFEGTPGAGLAYDGSAIIVTQTSRNLERLRTILAR
jgi:general secretion pathway protein D